ncbi:hypothetical protein [Actinobacillus ureae]
MQITDKYKAYANLKRRVITPALEEINSKTDYLLSLSQSKTDERLWL